VASLGTMYSQALKAKVGYAKGWILNWPLQESITIGRVADKVFSVGDGYSLWGDGRLQEDYGVAAGQPQAGPEVGPLIATDGTVTNFNIGIRGSTPDLSWLGNAAAGVSASFGKGGGFRLEASKLQRSTLPSTAALMKSLRQAVNEKRLVPGNTIVIGVETATTAFVVASENSDGSLQLTLTADVQPGAIITLATFATGFTCQSSKNGARAIAFPNPVTTAFQAVTVGRRGIFFWREIPIKIMLSDGDTWLANLSYAEKDFTKDDYFTMFDSQLDEHVPIRVDFW
jgi:hypothetical protein